MPQQHIYTSAPRGIVAGRSGHCTVARSAAMREALMLQLEKFSYYQHLSLSGGRERPIYSARIVDIRGTRYHVLSRIQDAGLDFTGRTNFIAHHLVFTPDEIRQFPSPPVILGHWPGWQKSWAKEPQLLENEDWTELAALAGKTSIPALTWQKVTGDSVNGFGLLESRAGATFRVDDVDDETVLQLMAESLELLEVRDARLDFRATAWNYTFTTSMQEQDNPADFKWRCIHTDNPAANRFATPDCKPLSAVRAIKWTGEETAFAREGRQAPRLISEPQDVRLTEGETARFAARADGLPAPAFQWYSVDRANNVKILPGETNPEFSVNNPPLGVSRYIVTATNSAGEVQSRVATLSVERKLRLTPARVEPVSTTPARAATGYVKSGDQIERQRRQIETEEAQEFFVKRLRRRKILGTVLSIILLAILVAAAVIKWGHGKKSEKETAAGQTISTNAPNPSQESSPGTNTTTQVTNTPASPTQVDPFYLPPPWTQNTIGGDGGKAFVLYDSTNDIFTLKGGGKKNEGANNNFFFVSRSCSRSFEFTARLSTTNIEAKSLPGIMMRTSTNADAPFVFIGLSLSNVNRTVDQVQRDLVGAKCAATKPQSVPADAPIYFRIHLQDKGCEGSFSIDGANWTSIGTTKINMPVTNYLVGFAICSGNNTNTISAEFDHYTITPK